MKIVVAPDSFKGSASSQEISQWIESGIHSVIPECEIVNLPIGDGGEGTLSAVQSAGFELHEIEVIGPSGNTVHALFGMRADVALVELAEASGLAKLLDKTRAPLTATSFGTGQLIQAALDRGAKKIILAVGGSATTDAGAGALQALGARLRDSDGQEISLGGAALLDCSDIDLKEVEPRIHNVEFILASDVTNPLTGPNGAARIYAPQKGASVSDVTLLEKALEHFAELAGSQHSQTPGSGSAGGFGFMALTFLRARFQSGIDTVLELVDFEHHLKEADLVITGEGKFDSQSLNGKAPIGILKIASQHGVPVALICGQSVLNSSEKMAPQFTSIHTLISIEPDEKRCINHPQPIIETISVSIAKSLIT
jgi:glycerate 2-kinase